MQNKNKAYSLQCSAICLQISNSSAKNNENNMKIILRLAFIGINMVVVNVELKPYKVTRYNVSVTVTTA